MLTVVDNDVVCNEPYKYSAVANRICYIMQADHSAKVYMPPPVERLDTSFAYHPLSPDEEATCSALLDTDDNSDLCVMPTHNITSDGFMEGFKFAVPEASPATTLPITRQMFFGHSAVECSSYVGANPDVIALLSDTAGCQKKMRKFLLDVQKCCRDPSVRAGFHCIPQNVDAGDLLNAAHNRAQCAMSVIDSANWQPETPTTIGLYHAFTRGFNQDCREHKLFLCVTGGCTAAAESYYNLLLDIAESSTVDEIIDGEETWWLRSASSRSRARLLKMLGDTFDVCVPSILDVHSYDRCEIARVTTETFEHDIRRLKSRHVAVFNKCTDPTMTRNGILTALHPLEGYRLFRGPALSNSATSVYGGSFGSQTVCGAFPTGTFKIWDKVYTTNTLRDRPDRRLRKQVSTVITSNSDIVVEPFLRNPTGSKDGILRHMSEYLAFDEAFMKNLEKMQFDRNYGMVEMMPIIVGVGP